MEFTERYSSNGKIISIDFKKAFDSVSRYFLLKKPFILSDMDIQLSSGFEYFIKAYQAMS